MFSWSALIDEEALATLLPLEYSRFARPVRDALVVFLGRLPHARQTSILAAQETLPACASVSQRLGLLAQSCPVLHKLGQVLARDRRLAWPLREQLQMLESMPPSVPTAVIEASLVEEFGPLENSGITLLPPAIAEASVGVVIPFEYAQERGAQARQGVFKLLKPGVQERLEQELALLQEVGAHLDERCHELDIPPLDYQEAFGQVRDKLRYEVRLADEQRHLVQARKTYADDDRVEIPELLEQCSARVTAMGRIHGCKITDHALTRGSDKRKLAELVVQTLIARPIFTRERRAMFHSDPHAGNLIFTDEGRLAILDWSLVGTLGENERIAIVQLMLGAATLNAPRVRSVIEWLSDLRRLDRPVLGQIVDAWLRRIRCGEFPGMMWLMGMLDDAVQHARLRIAADLMLFRKALHTLAGVIASLGGEDFNMDEVLCREFLGHFAVEWPRRWFSLPHSHDFSTRISNLDLARMMLGMPATAARFWSGQASDLLHSCQTSANGPPN